MAMQRSLRSKPSPAGLEALPMPLPRTSARRTAPRSLPDLSRPSSPDLPSSLSFEHCIEEGSAQLLGSHPRPLSVDFSTWNSSLLREVEDRLMEVEKNGDPFEVVQSSTASPRFADQPLAIVTVGTDSLSSSSPSREEEIGRLQEENIRLKEKMRQLLSADASRMLGGMSSKDPVQHRDAAQVFDSMPSKEPIQQEDAAQVLVTMPSKETVQPKAAGQVFVGMTSKETDCQMLAAKKEHVQTRQMLEDKTNEEARKAGIKTHIEISNPELVEVVNVDSNTDTVHGNETDNRNIGKFSAELDPKSLLEKAAIKGKSVLLTESVNRKKDSIETNTESITNPNMQGTDKNQHIGNSSGFRGNLNAGLVSVNNNLPSDGVVNNLRDTTQFPPLARHGSNRVWVEKGTRVVPLQQNTVMNRPGAHNTTGTAAANKTAYKQPEISWAQRISGLKPPKRSLNLQHIEPLSVENGVTVDSGLEHAEPHYFWSKCLAGYCIGSKPLFHKVEAYARTYWEKLGLDDVSVKEGFFMFHIPDDDARKSILDMGNWLIGGQEIRLEQWDPTLRLRAKSLRKIAAWVKITGIPLAMWTEDGLSRIASGIGRPLYGDSTTERLKGAAYARICIEVDASKVLPKEIHIKYFDEIITCKVEYQWLPAQCFKCNVFGHNCNFKKQSLPKGKEIVSSIAGTRKESTTTGDKILENNKEKATSAVQDQAEESSEAAQALCNKLNDTQPPTEQCQESRPSQESVSHVSDTQTSEQPFQAPKKFARRTERPEGDTDLDHSTGSQNSDEDSDHAEVDWEFEAFAPNNKTDIHSLKHPPVKLGKKSNKKANKVAKESSNGDKAVGNGSKNQKQIAGVISSSEKGKTSAAQAKGKQKVKE